MSPLPEPIETAVAEATGSLAHLEGLSASGGWCAPSPDDLDVPPLSVSRGGIEFPPPLAAGLALATTVAHVQRDGMSDGGEEIYFVWRGKMWKAFAI